MLKYIEQEAKNINAKAIALETQKVFNWAINFYKKNGYKVMSWDDLNKKPFIDTLKKAPVESTYVFGKIVDSRVNNS